MNRWTGGGKVDSSFTDFGVLVNSSFFLFRFQENHGGTMVERGSGGATYEPHICLVSNTTD